MGNRKKDFQKKRNNPQQSLAKVSQVTPSPSPNPIIPLTQSEEKPNKGLQSYSLDQMAQRLVLDAKKRDPDSLNQAHKMRMATAYGLERFWGEHLRLQQKEPIKSQYWKETWDALVAVMKIAGFTIPNDPINRDDVDAVLAMSVKLWELDIEVQRVALVVLTQLCDCIVWWTQRHK